MLLSRTEGRLPHNYCRSNTSECRVRRSPSFVARCPIMAADLARLPHSGLHAQLCGDAHVQNLDLRCAGRKTDLLNLNDFDETHPWPVGVGREADGHQHYSCGARGQQNRQFAGPGRRPFAESYFRSTAQFARQPLLEVARHLIHGNRACGRFMQHSQSERVTPLALLTSTPRLEEGRAPFQKQAAHVFGASRVRGKDVLSSLKSYPSRL